MGTAFVRGTDDPLRHQRRMNIVGTGCLGARPLAGHAARHRSTRGLSVCPLGLHLGLRLPVDRIHPLHYSRRSENACRARSIN